MQPSRQGHTAHRPQYKPNAVTNQQLAASLCQVLGQLLEVDGTSSTTCQGLVKNLQQRGSFVAQAMQLQFDSQAPSRALEFEVCGGCHSEAQRVAQQLRSVVECFLLHRLAETAIAPGTEHFMTCVGQISLCSSDLGQHRHDGAQVSPLVHKLQGHKVLSNSLIVPAGHRCIP